MRALSRWKRGRISGAGVVRRRADTAPATAFGPPDAALSRCALPRATPAATDAADAVGGARRLFHWELVSRVFFDRSGRASRCDFDAVIGNPPWDMIHADSGGRCAVAGAARHRAAHPVPARCRSLHGAIRRPRQPLSAVRRAGDWADARRRPHRSGAAVGARHGPGQRAAAPAAALALPRRRDRRHGQPTRRLSDSSQRPVSAGHGIGRKDDRPDRVPPRRGRSRGARIDRRRHLRQPFPGPGIAGSARAHLRPGRGDPEPAQPARSGDRRARRLALSAARQRRRLGGAVWPGAQCQRRPRGVPTGSPRLADRRGKHLEPFHVALEAVGLSVRAGRARLLRADRHEHPRLAYRDVASATRIATA